MAVFQWNFMNKVQLEVHTIFMCHEILFVCFFQWIKTVKNILNSWGIQKTGSEWVIICRPHFWSHISCLWKLECISSSNYPGWLWSTERHLSLKFFAWDRIFRCNILQFCVHKNYWIIHSFRMHNFSGSWWEIYLFHG